MADINITLDAKAAITNANALVDALNKVELAVKRVSGLSKKLSIMATLKVPRLVGDLNDIQRNVTARTRAKPLKIYAEIVTDKRRKQPIETFFTRGMKFRKVDMPGVFAEKQPLSHAENMQRIINSTWSKVVEQEGLEDQITHLNKKILSAKARGADTTARNLQVQKYLAEQSIRDVERDMREKTPYDIIGDVTREKTLGIKTAAKGAYTGDFSDQIEKDAKKTDELNKALQRTNATKRQTSQINKMVAAQEERQVELSKKVSLATGNIETRYKAAVKERNRLTQSFKDGEISLDTYNKGLKDSEKRMKGFEKEAAIVAKGGGRMATMFGKITAILIAISAGLFILQKLQQYITSIISIGSKYSDVLTKIQAETQLSRSETEDFANTLRDMAEGTVFTIEDLYGAYKELRNQGLGYKEALDKSVITSKIARNEQLKLADAAKIAAYDVHQLAEYYSRYNDIASQTTAKDAWAILKKDVSEIIEKLYRAGEPFFVVAIEGLKPIVIVLIALIAGITAAFAAALAPVAAILGSLKEMADVIRIMPDLKFWGKGNESLESQLERATDAFLKATDKTHKSTAERFSEVYSDMPEAELGFPTEVPETVEKTTDLMTKLKKAAEGTDPKLRKLAETVIDIMKELKKSIPNLADKLDPKEILKAHQELYKKLGVTTKYLFDEQTIAIKKTSGIISETAGKWTELINEVNTYNQEQAKLKPQMDALKSVFDALGSTADKYWIEREKQIRKEIYFLIQTKKVTEEMGKAYERALISRLYLESISKRKKGEEETFDTTGYMSEWLRRRREIEALTAFRSRAASGIDPVANAKKLNLDMIKIKKDEMAKFIEIEKEKFEKTGIISGDYTKAQLKMLDLMYKELVVGGMSETDAKKLLRQWQIDLSNELIKPTMDKYQMLYDDLHIMSKDFYDYKVLVAERSANKIAELTKNEKLANEWMQRRAAEINIEKLRTGLTSDEGIEAGIRQLAMDNEPLANRVADAWIQGATNVGQAWKSAFFDVMEMNFKDLESTALSVLKAIQRMLIDILYQQTMYSKSGLLTQISGALPRVLGSSATQSSGFNVTSPMQGYASGGWITEPISGIGLHTGKGYTLGEAGPEYVAPKGKVGIGQAPNMKVVVQNNTGVESTAEQGEVRWDGDAWVLNVVMNASVNNKFGYRDMIRSIR